MSLEAILLNLRSKPESTRRMIRYATLTTIMFCVIVLWATQLRIRARQRDAVELRTTPFSELKLLIMEISEAAKQRRSEN